MSNEIQQIKEKIKELENRIIKLEKVNSPIAVVADPSAQQKKVSPKEFMLSQNPSSDVEKTLAVGYYLEKFENMESFNAEEITSYFKLAKEKIPQNINDKVNMNIKKGHIMELKEKKNNRKAWCLTSSGEVFVENNFKENND